MAHNNCWADCCDRVGLGCCIGEDDFKQRPLTEITQNDKRHCTDVPCLLALILVLFSELYLIIYASGQGANPNFLMHGWDYNGDLCDSSNSNGSLNAWPDLTDYYRIRVCVQSCSQTQAGSSDTRFKYHYDSEEFLNGWCVPSTSSLANLTYQFNSASEVYQRGISDLNTTKWLIFISSFIAIIISFIYLKLIGCIGRCLVWLTIIALYVGGIMLSYILIKNGVSDYQNDETKETGQWELGIGIIVAILLFLIFLSLFWMKKRIDLAVHMLDEASHAIRDVKTTIMFPILYSGVAISYIAFWICIALYIYSVKIKESDEMPTELQSYLYNTPTYYYYAFDTGMKNALIWHFICLFYVMQVIIYFGFMVLSGVIADWYFSEWDPSQNSKIRGYGTAQLSNSPFFETLWRVLRFHMGSLAFGSLLITIIRVIRVTLKYIEEKTKGATENPLSKCLFACVQCCLKCFQCVLDKISKEGFVFTTIYGTAFCYSSLQALKLLWSNIARATMVEGISTYMEYFGRIGIAALTTGICAIVLSVNTYYVNNVSSLFFPCIVIFLLSYLIGSLFMMVFEVGVDTIFLCFLVDEVVNGTPRFASERLLQHQKFSSEHNDNHSDKQTIEKV